MDITNLIEYYNNNKDEINQIAKQIIKTIDHIRDDLEINDLTAIIAILAMQQHIIENK